MLKQKQLKFKFILFTLALLLPFFALLQYKAHVLREINHKESLDNKSQQLSEKLHRMVFSPAMDSARKLTQKPEIVRSLEQKAINAQQLLLPILETTRDILDADIIYLMNPQGTVIASTTYDEKREKTLLGLNYAFRPYFFQAMKNQRVIYPAVGVTTFERGIYFSYPIQSAAKAVEGVLCVKINMKKIDSLIAEKKPLLTFLVTREGIIFSSSNPERLFHHVYPLDHQIKDQIQNSLQFSGKTLKPLESYLEGAALPILDGLPYSLSKLSLPQTDWQLITLAPQSLYSSLNKEQENLFYLVSILLSVMVLIISYLYYNILERRRAEKKLKSSLDEKNLLIKEIHHRVKNNFQIINGLLFLQSRHIEDPEILKIFQESQDRIHSMTLIHEKLYQSENLQGVHFKHYLESLVKDLLKTYIIDKNKDIRIQLEIEDLTLPPDIAIPCGLLINELITNSIKYAFAGQNNGEIKLKLSLLKNQMLSLIVQDNGSGIPGDIELETSTTLGFSLINSFASKLGAELKLSREKGTTYEFTFPFTK